jgi:molybdate transport system substrate-binding protein
MLFLTSTQVATVQGISSMATKRLLAQLADAFAKEAGIAVAFESVGGVDAARRLDSGEAFDLVVLASKTLASLAERGKVDAATQRPFAISPAALAVRRQAPKPPIDTLDNLLRTLRCAASIGYSTGPSGDAFIGLLDRCGILAEVGPRLQQAPPGVPVAQMISEGRVDLGLQQLSELADHRDIAVLGTLPAGAAIETIFSVAVGSASRQRAVAQSFIRFLDSPAAQAGIRKAHMAPAQRALRRPLTEPKVDGSPDPTYAD